MQVTGKEQYVEFGIQHEQYAIRIEDILEIIKVQDITPLPSTREFVKGVINLRGTIIPVISLRCLLGMAEQEETKTSRIIVIQHQEEILGMSVDYVNKVITFRDIQLPPEQWGGIRSSYFTGIGVIEHRLVSILQLDEVLLQE